MPNTIPVGNIERVEVLRDGARAALYGSDAVAGVVNNVLQSDYKGRPSSTSNMAVRKSTNLREFAANGLVGFDFDEGRGNISIFGGYAQKSKLYLSDQDYTSQRRSARLCRRHHPSPMSRPGTAYQHQHAPGAPSASSVPGGGANFLNQTLTSNGTAFTNSSGQFHIQPSANAGCPHRFGHTRHLL
ncbi:TonB-dependent receptor plug domain-containing protein [Sphingobium yanoikuyae]|uniref:TonB-dependent receptor plug domain-containing protein n=1 Tax=Sphingobium yanoikuyae TaxID=13690 RepID=UPI00345EB182